MCGILAIFGSVFFAQNDNIPNFYSVDDMLEWLSHRGPDDSGSVRIPEQDSPIFLLHSRLAVRDANDSASSQPFVNSNVWTAANGEIYNSASLEAAEGLPKGPDLAYLHRVLSKNIPDADAAAYLRNIHGMFAVVSIRRTSGTDLLSVRVARDPFQIKPLIMGITQDGIVFSSELGPIHRLCAAGINFSCIQDVQAGYLLSFEVEASTGRPLSPPERTCFYDPRDFFDIRPIESDFSIRACFYESVRRRLIADGPVAVLLSGGLDSAILASVAKDILAEMDQPLYTFTISMENGGRRDSDAAAIVASHIGSIHREVYFTEEEGISAIPRVIEALGTSDMVQIRASVPLYLLAKNISRTLTARGERIRVVLCGEGADELFGGYALFRSYLPSETNDLHYEIVRRTLLLGTSELLRVDRCTMAHGIEARVPYLDKDFVNVALRNCPATLKLSSIAPEKAILRREFTGRLPSSILARPKEQFADGLGPGWITALKKLARPLSEEEYFLKLYGDIFGIAGQMYEASIRAARRLVGTTNFRGRSIPHIPAPCAADDPDLRIMVRNSDDARQWLLEVLDIRVEPDQCSSLDLLREIVAACLHRIPFQNATILARPRRPPTPGEIRADMWQGWGGGCIVINTFLAAILASIGFRVHLMRATISQPDCHVAILVSVGGIEPFCFVDAANGKPYVDCPYLTSDSWYGHGNFSYCIRFDEKSRKFQLLHRVRCGDVTLAMTFDPTFRDSFAYFLPMVQRSRTDTSYGPFLREIRLCLYDPDDRIIAIKGRTILEGESRHQNASREDIMRLFDRRFGHLGSGFKALLKVSLDKINFY